MRPRPGFAPILAALSCVLWTRQRAFAASTDSSGPVFSKRGCLAGILVLLAVLASPRVAHAEWLPGDPLPMPEDALWQPMRIPTFGMNNLATRSFAEHQGKLVIVGTFDAIGRTRALGAVSWDGASFERLGTPTYKSFYDVLSWNGSLLVSRGSSSAVVHDEILAWNGSDWDSFATANGAVLTMQSHQGGIVVVGTFTVIGGVAAHHAAFFDGSAWNAMGTGISASFTVGTRAPKVMSVGSDVYVQYSSTIERYDGSNWTSNTGSALNGGPIRSIATDGVDLYACGDFTKAGADSCPGVGRWDGSAWHRVGVGTPLSVSFITWWNGQLVGWITDGTSRVSVLNGTHWQGLGDATGGAVFGGELETCGDRLVLRAEHRPLSGAMADVRVYDGVNWIDVVDSWGPDMTGTNFYTISAAEVNDLLYLCGGNRHSANVSGAIRTLGVSAWNGSAWSALGIGLGGQPTHIDGWGSDVIVTGNFTLPGGRAVAGWDGTNWSALGDGSLGSYVWDATPFRDTLYGAHDGPVRRRSGSPWSTVGTNGGTNGPSYALLDWNDRLVVTGAFTAADGQPASRIAAWDGTQWSGLGAGLNGDGIALCAHAGDVVVGGDFTTAGGQPATGAARWDGTMWHAMGTNALFIVDFAELAGTLYAAGVFRLEDDSRVNTVARWTGTQWQLLGSGMSYTASTYPSDGFHSLGIDWVEGYQGDLYCGGPFAFVFGQVTSCIARLPAANTVAVEDRPGVQTLVMRAAPNPSHGPMTMSFALPQAGRVRLVVLDVAGREVARLVDGEVAAGHHEVRWAAAAPPGIYFALLQAPGANSRVTRVVRLE